MNELTTNTRLPNPARVYIATLSPRGRKAVAYQLRQVATTISGSPDIDRMPWHLLNRAAVIAVLEKLRLQGLATSTRSHCLSVLKRVAEEAWHSGQMPVETYQQIRAVRPPKGQGLPAGRAPSREEVRQALDAALADDTLKGLRDAALIATLAGAGLRCFEAAQMQRSDYQGGRLRTRGKGDKHAWQPLSPSARELLEAYLDALPHPTEPLFVRWHRFDTPGTSPLSESGIREVLLRWFDGLSPHDLRRGYATWLDQDGQPLTVIQRMMRHANPATTAAYIRNEDAVESASEGLQF